MTALWQTIVAVILGGLLSLFGSYFAHRWQYQRTIALQRRSTQEKTYARLSGLRIVLRQALVSRFEALIFSDYHEYKWRNFGGSGLDLEEAKRWMQKSEDYVDTVTSILRDIFECIADIHIAYSTTVESSNLIERIYNYKTPTIKSPVRGEVPVSTLDHLENWKKNAVSQLQDLVENECSAPLARLLTELQKQLNRDRRDERESTNNFRKDYLVCQALTCFFASFLFMRGYGLATQGARPLFPIVNFEMPLPPSWVYIVLGVGSLALSAFLCLAALWTRLIGIRERLLRVAWFPISVVSLAVFVTSWLGAIGDLETGSHSFHIFFWFGSAWFLFLFGYFIHRCYKTRGTKSEAM